MPDIQFGGEAFPIDIEPNPWRSELAPEHEALLGKPLPELHFPSTEATEVLLPLHQLGRSRIMIVFLPQVATAKNPLPAHLAENPVAQGGALVHQGLHDNYENLASIGFYYTFVVTTQSAEELRQIIRPEPRQQFPGLSDPDLKLADLLNVPTFTVEGQRYYEPFALILWDSLVEKVIYPITEYADFARWAFNWARIRRPDLDFLNYNLDRGAYTRRNG